jgi:hypothetical protein
MFSHLPLDDLLNHRFYIDEGLWRLVYAHALGQCVLRREAVYIEFGRAVMLIEAGELLWTPPERFEGLGDDSSFEAVRREHALLSAFLNSPAGRRLTRWQMRTRLETRLNDDRAWLARYAPTGGDAGERGDEG